MPHTSPESPSQQNEQNLRPLAWNGIRLQTPVDWEPGQLDRFYLFAGDGAGLGLECKFQQGKSISRKKALRRLRRALKGVEARMDSGGLSRELQQAFERLQARGFETQPFSWEQGERQAAGALLQCTTCGRSSLLQIYGAQQAPQTAATVLDNFADHEEDGRTHFELFGIRAALPAGFTLKRFSFKPGQYRLEFEGSRKIKRAGLVLERIGPVSVLLKDNDFTTWAEERFAAQASDGEVERSRFQGGPAVRWRPRRRGLRALFSRLLRPRSLAHVRAWQPAEANAVLCAALSGGGKLAGELFEEVCQAYVLAQKS